MKVSYQSTTLQKVKFISQLMKPVRGMYRMCGRSTTQVICRKGIHYEVDLNEAIDSCLYLLGAYESDLTQCFQRWIQKDMVVLDIGANIGAHTLTLAQHVGENGKVFAFEPTQYALKKLRRNILLNPTYQHRISVESYFLTDNADMQAPAAVSASWNIARPTYDHDRNVLDAGFASEVVGQCMTLDSWFEGKHAAGLTRLDAIKLDVDGGEVSVLKGAQKTIAKTKPLIFMELSPIHYEGKSQSFAEQILAVTQLGYCLETLKGKPLPKDPFEIAKKIPRGVLVNVLAKPIA